MKGLANDLGPLLSFNCASPAGLTDIEMWVGLPAEKMEGMLARGVQIQTSP